MTTSNFSHPYSFKDWSSNNSNRVLLAVVLFCFVFVLSFLFVISSHTPNSWLFVSILSISIIYVPFSFLRGSIGDKVFSHTISSFQKSCEVMVIRLGDSHWPKVIQRGMYLSGSELRPDQSKFCTFQFQSGTKPKISHLLLLLLLLKLVCMVLYKSHVWQVPCKRAGVA